MNHTTMIGPKNRPMLAVPRFCTMKSANKIIKVSGTTNRLKVGETTSSPSTAPNTEIAGVITPSP